jgi:uncharacterized membrane protein
MRAHIPGLLAGPILLLSFAACEYATEPSSAPEAPRQSLEAATTDHYLATVLPSGGRDSEAFVVLDGGLAFGTVRDSDNANQAVKWTLDADGSAGDPVLLGALPEPWQGASQTVRGTNMNGDAAVGYAQNDRPGPMVPWLWTNGIMIVLPLPEGATSALANAISETGVIVGRVFASNADYSRRSLRTTSCCGKPPRTSIW